MPIVLLAAGLVTFIAIGVAGASVIERYLAVPALALMVLAAVAIGGWTMLLPGWVRTAWMVGAIAIVIFGVGFTATRLNLSRFDNELRFRGQAHDDLTEVLNDPKVKAGLRCGPLTGPNHKIVPDARWIAGLGDGSVLAREWVGRIERQERDAAPAGRKGERQRPTRGPRAGAQPRAASRSSSPAASRSSSTPGPTRRRPADPGPARRASSASRRRGSTPRMSAAETAVAVAPAGGALGRRCSPPRSILRLMGLKTGLPYVYNADENSHFVPRAIGMFGHGLNPDYFINPPAFTYVLHALFTVRWGPTRRRRRRLRGRPDDGLRARPRRVGVPRRARGPAARDRRRAAVRRQAASARSRARCSRSPSCRSTTPLRAQRRADARAAGARAGRDRRHLPDRPHARVRLAGVGAGVAIATKYTAGILLVTLVAAAFVSPVAHAPRSQPRVRARAAAAPASWPRTRTRCSTTRRSGTASEKQTETAGEDGGKLGLANISGWRYYLATFTWGFGWLPSLFALGGAGALLARHRRLGLLLAPAPLLLFLYLGNQSRFFARWMLPVYPLLCLLAAWAVVALRPPARRPALALAALAVLARPGPRLQRPQRPRAGPRRHAPGRARLDGADIPPGQRSSMEPIAPDQWAMDPGQPLFAPPPPAAATAGTSGARPARASSTASCHARPGPVVKLEDYERTRARRSWTPTSAAGSAGSSPARPSSAAPCRPGGGAGRDALLRRAAQRGEVVFRISPYGGPARAVLVRLLVQLLPADVRAPGAGDRDLPPAWGDMRAMKRGRLGVAGGFVLGLGCRT